MSGGVNGVVWLHGVWNEVWVIRLCEWGCGMGVVV